MYPKFKTLFDLTVVAFIMVLVYCGNAMAMGASDPSSTITAVEIAFVPTLIAGRWVYKKVISRRYNADGTSSSVTPKKSKKKQKK